MFTKVRLVVIGTLVAALMVTGIGGTIALAQGPTTTPTAPAAGSTSAGPSAAQGTAKALSDLNWQALAQRLGTTVDKLQQAISGAQTDAINQAVKQGLITQAQATPMLQRGVNGTVANAGLDAAAKALGMTRSDLDAALNSGKTLLTVMQEKNGDATKLRAAIADAEKAALDQAVKDSKLTQAQADAEKAKIVAENIDLNQRFFGQRQGRGMGGLIDGQMMEPFSGMDGRTGGSMMGPQSGMQPGMQGGSQMESRGAQPGVQQGGQVPSQPGNQAGQQSGGQLGGKQPRGQ